MSGEIAIDANGVWKIFGKRADEALRAIHDEGLTKAQVLERFNCVVGVADASFQVKRGELFCVMGLSGSGKSTLVRHVNRLLEPTAGHIHINGEDVMGLDDAGLRDLRNRRVAMVFQNFGLMPHRTVRDNVAMPLEIRGTGKARRWEEADRVLDLVELGGWEDKYAHELSGGMQQRVGLARAIASDPEILLMDEPFSALDPLIRTRLQDELLDLQQKLQRTIIFVSHDLDEAFKLGNHIAIMEGGRIVQKGTPKDIFTNPANDYVADFVANMNPLGVLTAADVMEPLDCQPAQHIDAGASVEEAMRSIVDLEMPLAVISGGQPIGQISKAGLIKKLLDARPDQ